MFLTADYHTHTLYSHHHAIGSVFENAYIAKKKGLIELGISDHGFRHGAFGLRKSDLAKYKNDCITASKRYDINVKVGIESNIIGMDGSIDLTNKYYDYFDYLIAGVHKFVAFKLVGIFTNAIPNVFSHQYKKDKAPKWLIKNNTKALINVIKKNPVDIMSHPNFCALIDVGEVAKVCADYGTYFELNSKKIHLTPDDIESVLKTDVRFVISSDAHNPFRVGDVSLVQKIINENGVPLNRIDNIDGRLPDFRFYKFKERAGR